MLAPVLARNDALRQGKKSSQIRNVIELAQPLPILFGQTTLSGIQPSTNRAQLI